MPLPTTAQPWMAGANNGPSVPASGTMEPDAPDFASAGLGGGAAPNVGNTAVAGPASPFVGGPATEPQPHESIARHILDALGGSKGGPMDWAKGVLSGTIAGAANVGTVPSGGGWLTGAARGGQGVLDQRRQQAQDAQKQQQQQFENNEKLKSDERADKELQNQLQSGTAQRAMYTAQTAGMIQTQQQSAARFSDLRKKDELDVQKDELSVQQLQDQIRTTESESLSVLSAAGVDITKLDHITGQDQLTKDHVSSLGNGDSFAVPNGEAHKDGHDNAGAYVVPASAWDQTIKEPVTITSGWTIDPKTGKETPKTFTAQPGTKVGDLLAIAKGAQKDRLDKQSQIMGQLDIKEKQNKIATEALNQQLLQKQLSDPDGLKPSEVHQLQKAGQSESSKAQEDYNTFLQSANSIEGSIKAARNGNELASAIIPLQGTLFITTAEGVKRINETELHGVANAGNIIRQGQNAYEKFINGDTSEGTKRDLAQVIEIYKKAKYQQYLNNEEVTARNYRLGDKQTVFDMNGNPTSLGSAREGLNPGAKGDAGKLHGHMQDFAHQYTGGKGTIFSDDGQVWYDASGNLVK